MKNVLSSRSGSYGVLERLDIKGVEIGPPDPADAARLKAELARHGLRAMTVAGDIDLVDEKGVDRFDTLIRGAINMDAKLIYASAHADKDLPRETAYRRLRTAGDNAAAHGIKICLETHPILCHNGDEALRTIEGTAHDNVRVNFDTANIYYYNENVDAVEELKKVVTYVGSVHLKDTDGKMDSGNFPPLGDGVVDFPEIFRLLNEVGFHGPFTFELEATTADELPAALEKSVNYLRRTGCIE